MHTRASAIRTMAAAAVMALAASAGGCGGGGHSPPPNCLQVQPCGGDVVGNWSFLGACSDAQAQSEDLDAFCPGAKVNASGVSLTGILNFNADLTYTATNWHEVFLASETLPLSCSGMGSCTERNGTQTDTSSGSTVTVTTACSGTTTCECRVNGTLILTSDFGSYTTAGTLLNMYGGTTSGLFDYCGEQDRLHLISLSSSGQVVADIVAARTP